MALFKFGTDLLSENQASAAADANLNWQVLAVFTPQPNVLDLDLTAPPGSPTVGDVYIPLATATGDWAGQEGNFAVYLDVAGANTWVFVIPLEGMTRWIADTNVHEVYNGSIWAAI